MTNKELLVELFSRGVSKLYDRYGAICLSRHYQS